MNLRERKASRTRQRMIEVALDLFSQDGYDATTMEQIAAAADIGSSTLYRYFPTKDLLVLAGLLDIVDFAPALRARPQDEPIDEAITGMLVDVTAAIDDPERRIPETRRIIDGASVPRARLWDHMRTARIDFERAVAERMLLDPADLAVRITAGLALEMFSIVDELAKDIDYSRPHGELLAEVLAALPHARIVLPAAAVTA